MATLTRAVRMAHAVTGGHRGDRVKSLPAVFAGVFAFLAPLIEFVASFTSAIGMPHTITGGQRGYRRKLLSAVLTIEICHRSEIWLVK